MLNIVIPMAGHGSRFRDAGYETPKPLIDVFGKSMIERVVDNLAPKRRGARFIFICLEEHLEQYGLKEKLLEIAPGCEVIVINSVTEGAACTVLLARKFIDNESPMMIANCDQWVDVDIDEYLDELEKCDLDGLIMTMTASDKKWSFVGFGEDGFVNDVQEKNVISNEATVGIYNYRTGKMYVDAAKEMIRQNVRINNEFYVAPVYNLIIESAPRLGIFNIGEVDKGMYGLGVPDDLNRFLANKYISDKFSAL